MTDLTEQWKKGELPEGWYYCNTENGVEILKTWVGIDKYVNLENEHSEVYISAMDDCKIIAVVPSYDEWFKIKNLASLSECLQEKNIECLHRENKLKEALKDCQEKILMMDYDSIKIEILQKIDEVLK